jgi:uroporphyrin-III C-methyltransferase
MRSASLPTTQDEVSKWCLERLNEGKVVVRLKIGDPFVFVREGEEILRFLSHGYEPIVIPGISSALAAPLGRSAEPLRRRWAKTSLLRFAAPPPLGKDIITSFRCSGFCQNVCHIDMLFRGRQRP